MKTFETLQAVETELLAHAPNRMYAANYKLERIRALLAAVHNPHNQLNVIHVAGTSGKTSTAYYVRDLLEASGKRTGLTISPHISSICERLQIDGQPIAKKKFVAYFQEFYAVVERIEPRPTYFELMTAFVYWVFAKEQVEYAVVEVGLGGRYDATNVVERKDKVCVINSVGYDHTELLGETLKEIASEKAGIIQPENMVFTVSQEPEVAAVIEQEVAKQQGKLAIVKTRFFRNVSAPLFQHSNFSLALAAVTYVAKRDDFLMISRPEGVLQRTQVPGRFEVYHVGDKTVILDGAHNPQKLEVLFESLRARHITSAAVVAALSEAPEKKIRACLALLSSFASSLHVTQFSVQRDVLRRSADLSGQKNFYEIPEKALQDALRRETPYVVVTGSLYLVSILRPFLQAADASVSSPSLLH